VKREGSEARVRDCELLYRSLQLLHEEVTTMSRIVCPGAQCAAAAMLITIGFFLVKLGHHFNPFIVILFALIGLVTFFLYFAIMELLSAVGTSSGKYPKAHIRILSPQFRISCRQMRWKMGGAYYVTKKTFPSLIKNVVVKLLIKLIITF